MVVQKFGGTSVADPEAIRRLIEIVRTARSRDGSGPAVVVSAMSGVTDGLLKIAADASSAKGDDAMAGVAKLRERHLVAARDLAPGNAALELQINEQCDALAAVVRTLLEVRELSPSVSDVVAAVGELLSSRLVAAALVHAGLPGTWVDARKAIITTDDHMSARPLASETNAALRATVGTAVAAGQVPVLGGFVASTRDGHTTTLGRGGSDYSGALVGAGIGAHEIQIWTDVDGMLTADPRVVSTPRLVPHLSFAEAAELAYFGAKVLHPATILPAIEHDIPVRILNSRSPQGTGSVITAAGSPEGTPVTAFACKKDVTVIDITSSRMLMAYGFLRQVFEVFEKFRTAVDVVTTSEVSVSITVDDRRNLAAIVEALSAFSEVSTESEMALVCAVGDRLRTEPETAARVVGVLEEVPLRMISQAAARRNITVIMRQGDLTHAMQRLHEEFFGVNVLIVGYGKMGQLIDALAAEQGIDVAGRVDDGRDEWRAADVAIDFTTADALLENFPRYVELKMPVVIGTTGWAPHAASFRQQAERAGLGVVASANFSIGVNVFQLVVNEAARLMRQHAQYGAWIHEAHHATKRDAPSGTALMLRDSMLGAGFDRPIDMSATRAGTIPGIHTVGFDAASDTIELSHTARDRRGFAGGALVAAKWVRGRQGWFTMADVLQTPADGRV